MIVPTPAPPPAVDLFRLVKARGNVGDWFPQDSYPPAARRAPAATSAVHLSGLRFHTVSG